MYSEMWVEYKPKEEEKMAEKGKPVITERSQDSW